MSADAIVRKRGGALFGSSSSQSRSALASARTISISPLQQQAELAKSNGRLAFLVDTLAMVTSGNNNLFGPRLEPAEAITEVLNATLENVAQSFVSMGEMHKSVMIQDASASKFKAEVKSSQEHHFSLLQRETEKLRGNIEKMHSQLRYEIDKVTAGQRLDLNLERGRIRDELAKQYAETTELTTKLNREIHVLRAQLEAAKYDIVKYCRCDKSTKQFILSLTHEKG